MEHADIPAGEMHAPHQWRVASAAEREALTVLATDLGKYCWQQDDNSEWFLVSVEPVAWKRHIGEVDLAAKQDALVSGTNIKTINGESLLGAGNLVVAGGGAVTGDIILTARTLAAPEWLPADGGTYLQASYPALFGAVGLLTGPWTPRTSSFGTANINALAYGGGQWVAAGNSGLLATSPDGVTWTQRTSSFGATGIRAVAYGGSQWVAAGDSGMLATSPDGVTWTQRTSSFGATAIRALAYGGGQWVAAGDSGKLATSPDGVTWTQRTSSFGTTLIAAVAYGGSQWVAVGNSGLLATSPDGVTWTQRTSSFGTTSIYAVAYGGGQWVAAGNSGTLATASYPYTPATQFMLPAVTNPTNARYYIKA